MNKSIHDRVERLERRQKWFVCALVLSFLISYFAFKPSRVGAESLPMLRTSQLEIIDSAGVARLRLGAPLPDAILDGKNHHRRSPASGIQLNDAKGNEIGGLVMLNDGTETLCFDARSSEADCMYLMPSGERGFWIGDDKGKNRAELILGADDKTKLLLAGAQKNQVLFVTGGDGSMQLEARDNDGKNIWTH
jgi:hypothetical protein